MRLDSHVHLWRFTSPEFDWIDDPSVKRDFLSAELEAALEEYGIDGAVAVQARQSLEENRFLRECQQSCKKIAGVVGWIDLQTDFNVGDLNGLVGVRHIVQGESDPNFLARPAFREGVQRIGNFGLTYDLLIFAHQLPAGIEFCQALPEVRIVLDHCAKPDIRNRQWQPWADHITELAACPNVWCKISGLSFEADHQDWCAETLRPYVHHVLAAFGTDRTMIGSDWPVSLTPGSYRKNMEALDSCLSCLTLEDRTKIWGLTAARFYGIAVPGSSLER